MTEPKRNRARAIIFLEDKIVSMYREFQDRVFYTFPGGGMEGEETEEECVVREVKEEFGMDVRPVKKVYIYDGKKGTEHFYVCEWLSGTFGSGEGEEFGENKNQGYYKPTQIKVLDIPSLPLMPPEVAKAVFEDYVQNGNALRHDVKVIEQQD